jgi:glycosyltransferase involved in cell wall biosynthesis
MNYLFVHQNFPGQFKYLAPTLAAGKANRVVGFTMNGHHGANNLQVINYKPARGIGKDTHELVREIEAKVIRADAAYNAAFELNRAGFKPDLIVAHPGWGESLFLKDVWPDARLALYCEFYYRAAGTDVGFDPEFPDLGEHRSRWVRMKNLNNLMHLDMADAGIAPTAWQADTFPEPFRQRVSVIHDGILTSKVAPDESAFVVINRELKIKRGDEVITFVNRNLEPYRGYHVFMRALPEILRKRPKARVIIVGGNGVSYGRAPSDGQSWKQIFLDEVKADLDLSRVHFVGNLSYVNYLRLIQVSAVHVYLTYPFVLSWSLLESMSAGCAIVASNTGPLREVIKSGENGVLVDFFDRAGLAREVCALLEDPARRELLGRNARDFVVKNYDLNTVCLPKQIEWVRQLTSA